MKRFSFTAQEIDAHSGNSAQWHNFVRQREAEMIFAHLGPRSGKFRMALELGAGDGGQSVVIAAHCEKLICTEMDAESHAWLGQTILERRLPNVEYGLCNAEDLSRFPDRTFDLVFSSNLLEHVQGLSACLRECRRVLTDDGLMLHTMPSRHWKVFKVALSIARLRPPPIHGVARTHLEELRLFGRRVWQSTFEAHGFTVAEVVGFPFYFGHGPRFRWLIKLGNRLKVPGSFLYVLRKQLGAASRAERGMDPVLSGSHK